MAATGLKQGTCQWATVRRQKWNAETNKCKRDVENERYMKQVHIYKASKSTVLESED